MATRRDAPVRVTTVRSVLVGAACAYLLGITACAGTEQTPKELVSATPAPAPELIYVTDETGGIVVVVDPSAGTVVATIPVCKRPRGAHL